MYLFVYICLNRADLVPFLPVLQQPRPRVFVMCTTHAVPVLCAEDPDLVHSGGIGRDASELLRKVKAAQYVHSHPGEVCPAKWKEGEATLAPSLDLVGKI